jgi:hypothetical protein
MPKSDGMSIRANIIVRIKLKMREQKGIAVAQKADKATRLLKDFADMKDFKKYRIILTNLKYKKAFFVVLTANND